MNETFKIIKQADQSLKNKQIALTNLIIQFENGIKNEKAEKEYAKFLASSPPSLQTAGQSAEEVKDQDKQDAEQRTQQGFAVALASSNQQQLGSPAGLSDPNAQNRTAKTTTRKQEFTEETQLIDSKYANMRGKGGLSKLNDTVVQLLSSYTVELGTKGPLDQAFYQFLKNTMDNIQKDFIDKRNVEGTGPMEYETLKRLSPNDFTSFINLYMNYKLLNSLGRSEPVRKVFPKIGDFATSMLPIYDNRDIPMGHFINIIDKMIMNGIGKNGLSKAYQRPQWSQFFASIGLTQPIQATKRKGKK